MSSTRLEFPQHAADRGGPPKTPRARLLGNKLQEIAMRSPADLAAIEVVADYVLDRLDDNDRLSRKA